MSCWPLSGCHCKSVFLSSPVRPRQLLDPEIPLHSGLPSALLTLITCQGQRSTRCWRSQVRRRQGASLLSICHRTRLPRPAHPLSLSRPRSGLRHSEAQLSFLSSFHTPQRRRPLQPRRFPPLHWLPLLITLAASPSAFFASICTASVVLPVIIRSGPGNDDGDGVVARPRRGLRLSHGL